MAYDPIYMAFFLGFGLLQYVALFIFSLLSYRYTILGYTLLASSLFCIAIILVYLIGNSMFIGMDPINRENALGYFELIVLGFANIHLLFANVLGHK